MTEEDFMQMFDLVWDETHPPVTMGPLTWDSSRVLREMDPIAYREAMLNYANSQGIEFE